MSYKLVFKDEVKQDLIELSHSQRLLVFKQFSKLENSPELGKHLGNIVVGKRSDMKVYADASERLG